MIKSETVKHHTFVFSFNTFLEKRIVDVQKIELFCLCICHQWFIFRNDCAGYTL